MNRLAKTLAVTLTLLPASWISIGMASAQPAVAPALPNAGRSQSLPPDGADVPAGESLVPPAPPKMTSVQEVLLSDPIKLSVSESVIAASAPARPGVYTLSEAVKTGLANSPVLSQSGAARDAARFRTRAALARFGPNISFNTFYAASTLDQMLFYPFNDGTAAGAPMQPLMRGQLLSLIFAGTQPLFTGGFLTGNYRAAKARANQSLQAFQLERIATALRIKQAYWAAAWMQAKLQVDTDYVKFREGSTSNMNVRVETGKSPRAEYLREVAELARARQQVNQDYREYNQALVNLKAEMGINLSSLISLSDELSSCEPAGDINVYLTKAAVARPEIRQSVAKVDEARAQRMMARSAYLPHIDLYGLTSNLTGATTSGDANGRWGGMISVIGHLTLFDSGERFSTLRASNAAIREAQFAKTQTELKVGQDVANAWIDVDTARRNVELANSEVQFAEEDYRLTHARHLVGKAIPLEEFDAAIRLFRSRLKVKEMLYNLRLAQDKLVWSSGDL